MYQMSALVNHFSLSEVFAVVRHLVIVVWVAHLAPGAGAVLNRPCGQDRK